MLDHVNYDALDSFKRQCIEASRKTLRFAESFGFIPQNRLGASANVFALDLKPFLQAGTEQLFMTLVPEGLGTADEAKPDDLSEEELRQFWYNIGLKTVAVTTNDAASAGMQTILLGLYLPSSTPEIVFSKSFGEGFLDGIVEGCREVGCVYFSGETPQLKTKIVDGVADIAGAVFGLIPPGHEPIDGAALKDGDSIVFIESSGPGENGFTTLRQLAQSLPQHYRTKLPSGKEYWQAINEPSFLYTPLIQKLLKAGLKPSGVEPITGHGWQKIMRSAKPFRYVIENMLPVPEVFSFLEKVTEKPLKELINIFNAGVGLAVFIHGDSAAEQVVKIAQEHGLKAIIAGRVEVSERREVVVKPLDTVIGGEDFKLGKG